MNFERFWQIIKRILDSNLGINDIFYHFEPLKTVAIPKKQKEFLSSAQKKKKRV